MERTSGTVIVTLCGILVLTFQMINAATVDVDVSKKLENGEDLPEEKITRVKVSYECVGGENPVEIGRITVTPPSSLRRSDVKLYFANDVKNILQVTVTEKNFTGAYYVVPHSNPTILGTSDLTSSGTNRVFTVERWWFPENARKISASVQDEDVVYNFYGIKNYPISIQDKMVVENFKTVTCSD